MAAALVIELSVAVEMELEKVVFDAEEVTLNDPRVRHLFERSNIHNLT